MTTTCLIRVDTEHYGWIVSTHRSAETAERARALREAEILRREPDALTSLIYVVAEATGDVGDRVRYA